MSSLSWPLLALVFAFAASVTWQAGIALSRATDALDSRFNLGETFGGMLLLAISGTLPEMAIVVTAAIGHQMGLAAGNLLGGIAVQTAVLAIADYFVKDDKPLSFVVGSLGPVLESTLVVALTAIAMLGTQLPRSVNLFGVSPASAAIVLVWLAGMVVLKVVRDAPKWEIKFVGGRPGRRSPRVPHPTQPHPYAGRPTSHVLLVFAAGSIVTLAAGWALTVSGGALADHFGMNGIVFGATILALATALPEISSGIAAVRLGDHEMAMGDIFGGNAFQLCLFFIADLLAGAPVLSAAGPSYTWLAGVGILVTLVYGVSVLVRAERDYFRLGADSLIVIAVLIVGMLGLAVLAR